MKIDTSSRYTLNILRYRNKTSYLLYDELGFAYTTKVLNFWKSSYNYFYIKSLIQSNFVSVLVFKNLYLCFRTEVVSVSDVILLRLNRLFLYYRLRTTLFPGFAK